MDISRLIGTSLFWIGITTGVCTILDFLLREKHNKWIKDNSESIWFWLNEQGKGKLLKKFNSLFTLFSIYLIGVLLFLIVIIYVNYNLIHLSAGKAILRYFIVTLKLIPISFFTSLIFWVSSGFTVDNEKDNIKHPFAQIFLLTLIWLLFAFFYFSHYKNINIFKAVFNKQILLPLTKDFDAFCVFCISMIYPCYLILELICHVVVYLLMFFFKFFEYIFLRISEHPKGPILAISALLTGLGAIIKEFVKK